MMGSHNRGGCTAGQGVKKWIIALSEPDLVSKTPQHIGESVERGVYRSRKPLPDAILGGG